MAKFELSKEEQAGIIVSQDNKSLVISGWSDSGELSLTNQYGNSVSFVLDEHGFGEVWSALWEFVKDRQH